MPEGHGSAGPDAFTRSVSSSFFCYEKKFDLLGILCYNIIKDGYLQFEQEAALIYYSVESENQTEEVNNEIEY